MKKIVIISCTNRPSSNTLKVSKLYQSILNSNNREAIILDLAKVPENISFGELHGRRSEEYGKLIADYIGSHSNFIFVVPEYNGGFPGILKVFIDSIHPREWADKYACLVGVSNGRAGNLRGMEHLTGILNYLKMHIYHNKLPISSIDQQWDANGDFNTKEQLDVCQKQMEGFLKFIS